jgi:catechol 2,3-dioxygenase-like lactoylglutathione lyase family enzyme
MEAVVPILHVADAQVSSHWYGQLGFEVEWQHTFGPEMPLYVSLRRGEGRLHLSEHRLDGGPASHVYLYVDDVNSIVPQGAIPEDRPWGMREARLTDPDGNIVRIGSPLRERPQDGVA